MLCHLLGMNLLQPLFELLLLEKCFASEFFVEVDFFDSDNSVRRLVKKRIRTLASLRWLRQTTLLKHQLLMSLHRPVYSCCAGDCSRFQPNRRYLPHSRPLLFTPRLPLSQRLSLLRESRLTSHSILQIAVVDCMTRRFALWLRKAAIWMSIRWVGGFGPRRRHQYILRAIHVSQSFHYLHVFLVDP